MDNNKAGTMFGAIVVTVNQAEEVRDFYKQVIGWDHIEMNKGDYTDYRMTTSDGQPVAGVHHQAGIFANVPSVWISTFFVSDLRASLETCKKLGGKVLMEPMNFEKNSGAVIEYPVGAICGLCQM
ncbi:VOC family protein [Paenibacillus sp. KQZ6P-2]|uniref:VOC family protein n=1 Tax=Paenibacillus mangrovi TaxID=2931978 RepID=A0A9X1WXZ9_9BACL|nr:VOC family protein [Paenibacillus mangrovi]MCJ8014149.1 VOC family protein [Paenibacillus mangrovi]